MEEMIEISSEYARKMGLAPYYMYRQKNMVGNFENVGYCRKGCEGIYNIEIMEDIWLTYDYTHFMNLDEETYEKYKNIKPLGITVMLVLFWLSVYLIFCEGANPMVY